MISKMSAPTEELPTGEEKRAAVQSMFDTIAPRYDMVNRLMTMRLDVRWRKRTISDLRLAPGSVVLDLAAGTGDFCVELSKMGHVPIAIDLSYGMLASARCDDPLVQGDLLKLPIASASVDAAVCGFALRNLVSLEPFFAELHRVVRPGGRIALLDVSKPDNRVLRAGHQFYFNKVVPKVGALLSDAKAYAYLPKSVSYLPEPAELVAMVQAAGLTEVTHNQLTTGITQLITATRP